MNPPSDHEEKEEEDGDGNDSWTLEKAKVGSKNSDAFSNTAGCSVDSDFKSSPFNQRLLQHHLAHHNYFFSTNKSCHYSLMGGFIYMCGVCLRCPIPIVVDSF